LPLCDLADMSQSVQPLESPSNSKVKRRIRLVQSERQMLILF